MKLRLRVWIVAIILAPLSANATDYYVSPAGSDGDDGSSPAHAWQTIDRVNAEEFGPGDRILFEADARFTGNLLLDASDAGNPSSPLILTSYGTGRAIVDAGTGNGILVEDAAGIEVRNLNIVGAGPETNTGRGIWFYTEVTDGRKFEHLRIDNVDVSGFRKGGAVIASDDASLPGYRDVEITHSRFFGNGETGIHVSGLFLSNRPALSHEDVYIAHCEVFDNAGDPTDLNSHTGSGIILMATDGALIEFNHAYNNGGINSQNSGGPIGIWAWHSNNVTMQFNISHHNKSGGGADGGGFDLDGGMTNSVMQYNYSYENEGAGYLLAQFFFAAPFRNNVIRYNVSYSDGDEKGYGGIVLFTDFFEPMENIEIYGNTFYTTSASAEPVDIFFGFYSNVNFRNNIFMTAPGVQLIRSTREAIPPALRFQDNLYWTVDGSFEISSSGEIFSSLSEWQTAGQEMTDGVPLGIHADPKLVSPTTGEALTDPTRLFELRAYRLQPDSPAIDAGLDLFGAFGVDPGPHDFYLTPLPQDGAFDVGAAEFIPRDGDIGIQSEKLLIVDKLTSSGKARARYLAEDSAVMAGSSDDARDISARFDVAYDEVRGAFVLPADGTNGYAGWKLSKRGVARYLNKAAPAGATGAKRAVVKPGQALRLVGKSLGDTPIDLFAGGHPVGSVFTAYTVINGGETNRHCTRFPPTACLLEEIADGAGRRLVCRDGLPDAACAAVTP